MSLTPCSPLQGKYGNGFDDCDGESGKFPGERVRKNGSTSTFYQGALCPACPLSLSRCPMLTVAPSTGNGKTPSAHPAGASSNCKPRASPTGGAAKQLPYRRSVSARGAEEILEDEE